MKLERGLKVRWLSKEEQKEIADKYLCFKMFDGFSFENATGIYPLPILPLMDKYQFFKWRKGDVLTMGHPKTGTTWAHLLAWTMLNDPNLDHPCTNLNSWFKVVFMEMEVFFDQKELKEEREKFLPLLHKLCPKLKESGNDFDYTDKIEHMTGHRVFKSHLTFKVFDPKMLETSKVLYVMRNPKDSLVSYFEFARTVFVTQYSKSIEDLAIDYLNGDVLYGGILEHFKTAMEYKDHPNLYVLYYENLRKNTREEIYKLDKFFGTNLTEKQIDNVLYKTSFNVMKEFDPFYFGPNTFITNDKENFFRKGSVGGYKERLSPSTQAQFNKICREFFANYDTPYDFSD